MSTRRHRQKAQSRYAQLRSCRTIARAAFARGVPAVAFVQGRDARGRARFEVVAPAEMERPTWLAPGVDLASILEEPRADGLHGVTIDLALGDLSDLDRQTPKGSGN